MADYVSFAKLYTMSFEITDIFAMRQKWNKGAVFTHETPRKNTGILYLNGCVGEYSGAHGELTAPQKSILCLPAKSKYSILNKDCGRESPDAYLVEFNIISGGETLTFSDMPFALNVANSYMIAERIKDVVHEYCATVRSPSAIRAAVLKLISELGRETLAEYNKKYLPIARGIELLENDPLCKLTIEEIAQLCSVSGGCFRRLFHEYSGKSPTGYRLDAKISMAEKMLESGGITLEILADSLGFETSAYFCRLFKKKTGMTPGEYRKNLRRIF